MEVYARVRRAVQVDGMSIRQAATGVRAVTEDDPEDAPVFIAAGLGPQETGPAPQVGPWLGIIEQILVDDKTQPKKQRHTAKRIFGRLKAGHSFSGGYTIVKDYVRQARLTQKEVFVPRRSHRALHQRISAKRWW